MTADYLNLGTVELTECAGRTWFDTLVEGWHDQGMMRKHMEGLHELDLERAQQRPVINVTLPTPSGPLQFTADPDAQTVAFRIPGSGPLAKPGLEPVLPAHDWEIEPVREPGPDETAWLPGFGPEWGPLP